MTEAAITAMVWCFDDRLGDEATKWDLENLGVHWNCGV